MHSKAAEYTTLIMGQVCPSFEYVAVLQGPLD